MVDRLAEIWRRVMESLFPSGKHLLFVPARRRRNVGSIVMTPRAQTDLPSADVTDALLRHFRGDDGDLDDCSHREPERHALDGARRLSVFRTCAGRRFWIITEADSARTTVLLPEEFGRNDCWAS